MMCSGAALEADCDRTKQIDEVAHKESSILQQLVADGGCEKREEC